MSGTATNLFRSIGLMVDLHGKHVSALESADAQIVEDVFLTQTCLERRYETEDGRIWVRKTIPLRMSSQAIHSDWFARPWYTFFTPRERQTVDAVLVLIHNATEAVQKQRELNVKSAIIQEVHHRVKNNLQTVAAMLRLQARRTPSEEAKQQLLDAVNRIFSISVIHEFLSQDEHQPINIRDVCQRIAHQVAQVVVTPEQEIDIRIDGSNIRLPASQATPAAMVINELMLNAVEHGLKGRLKGSITIELNDLGDSVQIVVQNSGSGLPPNFDLAQSKNLGLQIIHTLVTDDLKGEFRLDSVEPEGGLENEDKATQHNPQNSSTPPALHCGVRAVVAFPKRSLKVD
jgi:two-component sensor histidine kinase